MSETRPATTLPSRPRSTADVAAAPRSYWPPIITVVAWLIIATVVLRFDFTVARTISLFGLLCLVAVANELLVGMLPLTQWRILHYLLAVSFAIVGAVASLQADKPIAGLVQPLIGFGTAGVWKIVAVLLSCVAAGAIGYYVDRPRSASPAPGFGMNDTPALGFPVGRRSVEA